MSEKKEPDYALNIKRMCALKMFILYKSSSKTTEKKKEKCIQMAPKHENTTMYFCDYSFFSVLWYAFLLVELFYLTSKKFFPGNKGLVLCITQKIRGFNLKVSSASF